MDENPDDLDLERLLESRLHLPEPGPGFRESLLLRTSRLVEMRARRARWARRGIAGAAAALLFGAGFASARMLDEGPSPGAPISVSSPDRPVAPIAPAARVEPIAPEDIRRQVSIAPAGERRDLLRRAGDAYLARDDLEGALECYRQVVEIDGTEQPRAASGREDAWLLAALRRSRDTQNRRGS